MPGRKSSSPARRARHAAASLRLNTLIGQVAPVAARRPGEAVSPALRRVAEDILFEARSFRPRGERSGLPPASPDYAGLAAQLAEALLTLQRFEGEGLDPDRRVEESPAEIRIVRAKFQRQIDMMVKHGVREKLAELAAAGTPAPSETPGGGGAERKNAEIYPRISTPH